MYGTQTSGTKGAEGGTFENDVKMYGTQTDVEYIEKTYFSLRMM